MPSRDPDTHFLGQNPPGKMSCAQPYEDLPHSPQIALAQLGPAQRTSGFCPTKVKTGLKGLDVRAGPRVWLLSEGPLASWAGGFPTLHRDLRSYPPLRANGS